LSTDTSDKTIQTRSAGDIPARIGFFAMPGSKGAVLPDGASDAERFAAAKKALEAVLFAAGGTVTNDKLSEALGLDADTVDLLCAELASDCEGRGIQLLSLGDRRQLCTREEYEPYIKVALGVRAPGGLSQSSLEVLAIIAYNQPATRVFVEQVRGVDSAYAITTLLERELIECVGKLDMPGRPNLYATTSAFLRCFGISSLDELPKPEIMKSDSTEPYSETRSE
jgi:segregation and condensation protein B